MSFCLYCITDCKVIGERFLSIFSGSRWVLNTFDSSPLEYHEITKSVTQRNGFFTFEVRSLHWIHIMILNADVNDTAWTFAYQFYCQIKHISNRLISNLYSYIIKTLGAFIFHLHKIMLLDIFKHSNLKLICSSSSIMYTQSSFALSSRAVERRT